MGQNCHIVGVGVSLSESSVQMVLEIPRIQLLDGLPRGGVSTNPKLSSLPFSSHPGPMLSATTKTRS